MLRNIAKHKEKNNGSSQKKMEVRSKGPNQNEISKAEERTNGSQAMIYKIRKRNISTLRPKSDKIPEC